MTIVIGSDKVGFQLKEAVKAHLVSRGDTVIDVGTTDAENPRAHTVTAPAAAAEIQAGRAQRGILICGTGMGMNIAANKNKGIYAAACESLYAAGYCRKINDANILCMGAFIVGESMALEMVDLFLDTEFVENFAAWRVEFLNRQQDIMRENENRVFK